MTQPAASKMLHELEEALGEALFERVGRGLALNPAGQAVLNTFRGMRNSMASLGRELHELSLGSSGKLLVGSITAAAPTYLSAAMIALKEEYPLLSIELNVDTSDRLSDALRRGEGKLVWLRAGVASVLSQIVDTLIFVFVAFYGVFPIAGLLAGQMLAKVVLSIVLVPPLIVAFVALGRRLDRGVGTFKRA